MPSAREEAAIQHGLAQDADNPEWTAADFASARPAAEMLPAGLIRRRGPGKRPAKVPVTLKLAPDALAALRNTGAGWQTRAAEVLATYAQLPSSRPIKVIDTITGSDKPVTRPPLLGRRER